MKQAKTLSTEEYKQVILSIESKRYKERNRCALALSYYGGLRVGEIAKLKLQDIQDPDGMVRDRIRLRAEMTKGNHARTVFVSSKLQDELEFYIKSLDPWHAPHDPLLLSQKGSAFSPNTLCQLFTRIYRDAGQWDASSHSGRRSFITRLALNGVSPKVIMTLAGHRQLQTTCRYIDVNDEIMKRAVEGL